MKRLAGRRLDELALLLMLAGLAGFLAWSSSTWRGDRVLYDWGLDAWRVKAPSDVVIVAIDDASIEAIGRWPWPRSVHATLLEKMASMKPRATLLDLVLSEADPDPAQDLLLAKALQDARPVLMPVVWQGAAGQPLRALEPVQPLRDAIGAAGLGASEPAVDADGVLRHAFLQAGPPGHEYPHLALAMLTAGGESVHGAALAAIEGEDADASAQSWRRSRRFLIRYTGPPGHMRRISYVDVLRGAVPAAELAGCYVFIGMTAQGLGDTLATPVNGAQHAMPGIEVLANVLHTLRSGDGMRAMPPLTAGLLSAALVAVLMSVFASTGARRALIATLISLPLLLAASWLAMGAGWWWSPLPYATAAALAYPLWSWRLLERAVDDLDLEVQRLRVGMLPHEAAESASSTVAPAHDHLSSRLRALRRATDTLRGARRFLADALAGMPTAMLVDDGHGRVLLANPLAAAIFEIDSDEQMRGLDLQRLLAEFTTEQPTDWAAALASARAMQDGVVVEARLAQQGDYVVNVSAADLLGVQRVIVTMADIAPIKRAQRQREELLAFVSHDLRSPASSIVLLADMNLAGHLSTPTDELLRELRRLAQRTLQMSEDFVRAAQAESRPLALAEVALAPMVEEVLADFRPQGLVADVALVMHNPQGTTSWVLDRGLVSRAIGNLISNAIKHSPRGASIECHAEIQADELVLRVLDRGPGLTPEQVELLARGDRGLNALHAGGVGFGLLFVQRVARRHGGVLWAHGRDDGAGSSFELHLGPLHLASGNP